ncbi:uncharacterized protein V1518DRAFT_373163 [Limtongia smithiae]|uniref:uncharacterized protein n=1 Tax=Limtongia smithiae TaxID=1125753 RepID=UPI0034CF2797
MSDAPAPAVADPAVVVASPKRTPSVFIAHLKSYPIVGATVDYTAALPLVKRASDSAKPYVDKYIHPAVDKAAPVLTRVDKLGDSTLTRVDKYVPALKATPAPDIPGTVHKSVETVKSTTHLYTEAAKTRVNGAVVEPTKIAVDKAKQKTVSFYDAKGRPFVRAKLDPFLAPVNTRLVALVDAYLPPAKPAAADTAAKEPATELGRLYLIGSDVVYRVKPIIEDKIAATKTHSEETVAYFASFPKAAKAHVIAVWEDKKTHTDLAAKPLSGRLYLTLSTGKQIVVEVVGYAESFAHAKAAKAKIFSKSFTKATDAAPEPVSEVVEH